MRLYYILWVDCITNIRAKDETNWQIKSMFAMSFAMMSNLLLFMTILPARYSYTIDLPFLPLPIRGFVDFLISFALPGVVINYLLIFYNKRYEKILKKYPYKKGKFFMTYFLISTLLPMVLLAGGLVLNRMGIIS